MLGVARYQPFWNQRWGIDHASGAGWAVSQHVQSWDRFGFGALRGEALLGAFPTHPPIGVTYAHHPPLFNWGVYAVVSVLGFSERSFRAAPILFSALSGVLIVLLASRRASPGFAAFAAALWLVLPMTFVYGIMCNPESTTVFFILLTVWLHDLLRTRSAALYSLVAVAHFFAGQMDWEGHFTVPALLLYEALRPRGDRRIGRVLVLGAVSVVSAGIVFVVQGYFQELAGRTQELLRTGGGELPLFAISEIPKYLASGVDRSLHTAFATVAGKAALGPIAWCAGQGRYLTEMYTWPAMLAVVAGVVLAFRKRTDGLVLGLALLVPGILNVLVFRQHAATHEFWTYYFAPGVVLTTTEVARLLLKPRVLAVVLLVAIAAFSIPRIKEKMHAGREIDFRRLAIEADHLLDREDAILVCDVRLCQITFYARHWIVADLFSGRSWEHLPELHGLKKSGALANPLLFLIVPLDGDPPFDQLAGYGALERLDPGQVAARLPTIAQVYQGPLWLLRVD